MGVIVKKSTEEAGEYSNRDDVFLVGEVAEALSPGDIINSLDNVLQILLDATGADDGELFLSERHSGNLLLAACRGPDRDALMTRLRFANGVGYPGIVVKEQKPLITDQLRHDSRFLRSAVKRRGINSYACIPLTDFGEGALGSLHMAWRRSNVPMERVARLLERVAVPISTAIFAGLAGSRMAVRNAMLGTGGLESRESWAEHLLQIVRSQTVASGGTLLLFDRAGKRIANRVSTGKVPYLQKEEVEQMSQKCMELCDREGVVLSPRGAYHLEICKKVVDSGHSACCAPLVSMGGLFGRIVLDYGENPSRSMQKELITLMAIADEATWHIPLGFFSRQGGNGRQNQAGEIGPGSKEGLVLKCLGEFSVIRNGEPVAHSSFNYRGKARTLLKYLLSRAGKPINKEALVEFLWPESDCLAAINRLHGVVHALRAAIETDLKKKEWKFIIRDGDGYLFNLESPLFVDFLEFQRLLVKASKLDPDQSEEELVRLLDEAVGLYKGDLYANEIDAEYFEADREHLRQLHLTAVKRLAQLRISRNELEQAQACLSEALRIHAVEECLHQGLIKLLIQQGKQREALKQFQRCVDILREELDVEPLPETLQLESQMLLS